MFNATAKRVPRKIEAMNDRQRDGTEYCLDVWAAWMRKDDRDLGIKGSRGESEGDAAAARRDNEIAEATEAMMQSLILRHRWAIWKKFGITTAWRFPNADLAESYVEAVAALEPLLRKNVATRMQFG
ncbi:hypothetical protein [Herbaspirillum frisingense]|uniref:hypothetical protein n=1 Tax=Herbaspirillum frisingense TaxID=92645 RepID=UPI0039AFF7CC